MKQVIDGKRYDTNKAEMIGSWSNNLSCSDFNCLREALYVTIKGNYFLSGEGGAMTKYSESCGNSQCDGSGIIPMDREEAFEWAQRHCSDEDEVMEHFKDMIEEA